MLPILSSTYSTVLELRRVIAINTISWQGHLNRFMHLNLFYFYSLSDILLPSQKPVNKLNVISCSPPYKIDQRPFTVYMLYKIWPTGPAHKLATQHVGYDQSKKINRGGTNWNQNHNIISLLTPDEFSIIIRTTKDIYEFNVITMTLLCHTHYTSVAYDDTTECGQPQLEAAINCMPQLQLTCSAALVPFYYPRGWRLEYALYYAVIGPYRILTPTLDLNPGGRNYGQK